MAQPDISLCDSDDDGNLCFGGLFSQDSDSKVARVRCTKAIARKRRVKDADLSPEQLAQRKRRRLERRDPTFGELVLAGVQRTRSD
jgi:hypothetical protein